MRERLDSWAEQHADRFKMVYVVGGPKRYIQLCQGKVSDSQCLLGCAAFIFCAMTGTRWKDFIIGAKTDEKKVPPPPEGFETLTKDGGSTVGVEGWIDEACVQKYAFPPAEDTQVFVCGLPSVYDSLCGPRTEKSLAPMSVLSRLGYTAEMVFKF